MRAACPAAAIVRVRVLVVDPNRRALDITAYALRREGIVAVAAPSGHRALALWQRERPDVIVLDPDVGSPDGLEVLQQIRALDDVPVLVVSEARDDDSVARAFALGADGYVVKPISPVELAGRVRAIHRRADVPIRASGSVMTLGDLQFDPETGELVAGGQALRLTPTEARLLNVLSLNRGQTVPSSRILIFVWGHREGSLSSLRCHVSHLRAKLRTRSDTRIVAVPGVGYRLEPAAARTASPTGRSQPQAG